MTDCRKNKKKTARVGIPQTVVMVFGWDQVADSGNPDQDDLRRRVYESPTRRYGRSGRATILDGADRWDVEELRRLALDYAELLDGCPGDPDASRDRAALRRFVARCDAILTKLELPHDQEDLGVCQWCRKAEATQRVVTEGVIGALSWRLCGACASEVESDPTTTTKES